MSKTRKGAQKVIGAVSDFAICTGTIVKPEKSFIDSTRKGEEIKVRTMEDKESGYGHCALKEIGRKDFFRHLGNIQTAEGRTSVLNVEMYDPWNEERGNKKEAGKEHKSDESEKYNGSRGDASVKSSYTQTDNIPGTIRAVHKQGYTEATRENRCNDKEAHKNEPANTIGYNTHARTNGRYRRDKNRWHSAHRETNYAPTMLNGEKKMRMIARGAIDRLQEYTKINKGAH